MPVLATVLAGLAAAPASPTGTSSGFTGRVVNLRGVPAPEGSDRFGDDDTSPFEADIEAIAVAALAAAGAANGCTPTEFCPHRPLRRRHLAAFLYRAFG